MFVSTTFLHILSWSTVANIAILLSIGLNRRHWHFVNNYSELLWILYCWETENSAQRWISFLITPISINFNGIDFVWESLNSNRRIRTYRDSILFSIYNIHFITCRSFNAAWIYWLVLNSIFLGFWTVFRFSLFFNNCFASFHDFGLLNWVQRFAQWLEVSTALSFNKKVIKQQRFTQSCLRLLYFLLLL